MSDRCPTCLGRETLIDHLNKRDVLGKCPDCTTPQPPATPSEVASAAELSWHDCRVDYEDATQEQCIDKAMELCEKVRILAAHISSQATAHASLILDHERWVAEAKELRAEVERLRKIEDAAREVVRGFWHWPMYRQLTEALGSSAYQPYQAVEEADHE